MDFSCSILLLYVLILQSAVEEAESDSTCETKSVSNRTLNLSINMRKDIDGDWLTTFHASKSVSKTNNITLDLTQVVYHSDDGEAVHIKGMIRANKSNGTSDFHSARMADRLTFHPNCGKNAAISDDGRSAQKINLDDPLNGVLLTRRPLRRNELFEVRLDKKSSKTAYCLGIGVTVNTPESFSIPDHMYNLKSGNWMMYHSHVYINGVETVKNYGRSFNELVVGDRVGVLVNKLGTLHFFVNGVDLGPAASNMPLTLHGVFELYYNAAKGTIIDPSP